MIAYIEGKIIDIDEGNATILAHGIGYKVSAPEALISSLSIGDEAYFHTHLAVRENSQDLYGFETKEQLQFFELLLSISGIGPKSALGILNVADIATLKSAISNNDSSYLTKVSGIGAKSAKKIVLELQGKIDDMTEEEVAANQGDVDVVEALIALGYSQHEVREIVKGIPSDVEGTNARIKHALKLLGK